MARYTNQFSEGRGKGQNHQRWLSHFRVGLWVSHYMLLVGHELHTIQADQLSDPRLPLLACLPVDPFPELYDYWLGWLCTPPSIREQKMPFQVNVIGVIRAGFRTCIVQEQTRDKGRPILINLSKSRAIHDSNSLLSRHSQCAVWLITQCCAIPYKPSETKHHQWRDEAEKGPVPTGLPSRAAHLVTSLSCSLNTRPIERSKAT